MTYHTQRSEFEYAKLLLKYLPDDELSSLQVHILIEQHKRSGEVGVDVNDYLGEENGRS